MIKVQIIKVAIASKSLILYTWDLLLPKMLTRLRGDVLKIDLL